MATDYIIITPVRNEVEHIGKTIHAVTSQSLKPAQWIIVDDGSSDDTGKIIDACAEKYSWVGAVHREDRGFRKAGGGVVEAFYDGYAAVAGNAWDFIVKLDGDLSFAESYFENCFRHFDMDRRLGIGGGLIANLKAGKLSVDERDPSFHVRGATKIYRRKCWDQIGGLVNAPGWDTLDEVKANMLGWRTRSFPELLLTHHRPTGQAAGAWSNWVKNGKANYISGYHPVFMLLKCLKRMLQQPYLLASAGLFWGFISGYYMKIQQTADADLIRYLRDQQVRRLTGRKTIWK